MKRNIRLLLSSLLFIVTNEAIAARIEKKSVNENDVQTVFVIPGKPLLIEFPCDVKFALPGTKTDLEIRVGLEKKNNITFWAHSMSDVVGINIKCGEYTLVYDVIPDRRRYQNFIKVTEISTSRRSSTRILIDSSEKRVTRAPRKIKRKLISEGFISSKQEVLK